MLNRVAVSLLLFGLMAGAWTAAEGQQSDAQKNTIDASTPRDIQVKLAMSAAPEVVSRDATIYVLDKNGYIKAKSGTNGFTCLVTRQHVDTIEPQCFDAESSATVLETHLFVEAERARGLSEKDIEKAIELGYSSGRFKPVRKSSIIYMMSDSNYLFDPERKQIIHFPGHIMFPAPYITYKDLGSPTGDGVPYIVAPGKADAEIIVIPASRSDKEHQHAN